MGGGARGPACEAVCRLRLPAAGPGVINGRGLPSPTPLPGPPPAGGQRGDTRGALCPDGTDLREVPTHTHTPLLFEETTRPDRKTIPGLQRPWGVAEGAGSGGPSRAAAAVPEPPFGVCWWMRIVSFISFPLELMELDHNTGISSRK